MFDNIQYPYAGMLATLVFIVIAALLFVGCKSLTASPQGSVTARVAVTYATAKYIEKAGDADAQGHRAQRILDVLDQVQNLAGADAIVTVDVLRAYVAQRLPVDLSPADRLLAGTLVDVAAQELRARIGEGALAETALLKVREILTWVREGATSYLPPGS